MKRLHKYDKELILEVLTIALEGLTLRRMNLKNHMNTRMHTLVQEECL